VGRPGTLRPRPTRGRHGLPRRADREAGFRRRRLSGCEDEPTGRARQGGRGPDAAGASAGLAAVGGSRGNGLGGSELPLSDEPLDSARNRAHVVLEA
jgi:hypothetical protein